MKVTITRHLSRQSKILFKKIISEYIIDDSPSLKILVVALEALDRANKAREKIDQDGMIINDRFGQAKAHPLIPVERDAHGHSL